MSLPRTRENDPFRLRHRLDWARTTERIAAGESRQSLDEDQMMQLAMARTLQIIGEAANNVTLETRRGYEMVPWTDIIGMRHRMVHVYYAVDLDVIWKTVTEHVPSLIHHLENLLEQDGNLSLD